jgi:hypothetical protein
MAQQQFKAGFNISNDFQAEGWLLKEGHGMISNWAERYFVLNTKTKTLSYYDNSDKKAVNKKGEYAFDSPKCKVEASSAKAGHPQCIFALGNSQNKDDIMTDLWIDAQTAEIKHKWISAIRKAIKGEAIVDTVKDKQNEIASDTAQINDLKAGPQTAATRSQIALLTEEIAADQTEMGLLEANDFCSMCDTFCTVM